MHVKMFPISKKSTQHRYNYNKSEFINGV